MVRLGECPWVTAVAEDFPTSDPFPDDRVIQAGSRIMRKFKDSENVFFGVLFMRMQPEDFRFLFEHLYGKRFSEEYEGKWEGSAPPPPLDL